MPVPICSQCKKTFARNDTLKLHIQRKHPSDFLNLYKRSGGIKCKHCEKCFSRKYTLKVHIKKKHAEYFTERTFNFQCLHCNKHFNYEHHLKSHLKVHANQEASGNESSMNVPPAKGSAKYKQKICVMCQRYSTSLTKDMLKHLENHHNVRLESEELKFMSAAEFTEWKSKIEEECSTQFRKETTKSSQHHVLTKYSCSRSGLYNPRGQGKRHLKLRGSKKINGFCPSSLSLVINTDGCCTVKYVKTHIGHKPDLGHMSLTRKEKEELARKIAQKIPFDIILDEIRESVVDSNLKRVHLSNRKDLFNVEYAYQLAHPPTWHKNDAISVEAWVNSMKDRGECVLFYKPQGVSCSDQPQFKDEDFILVIMTSSQKEMLKKHGEDIICLDGTHGTNGYNFELHTIVVVDELREGFPCAFLFSNRSDHEVLNLFFSEIQKQVGVIKCKTFMSDMADAYFNAWLQTMGEPEKRLYCTWHVDKAWRKNINSKITSKEVRALVYKQLRVLLQERDEKAFERMIPAFLYDHSQNPEMTEFLKYFDHYLKNPQTWAYCFRKRAGINTNMRLERLHRAIKYEYLNGKKVKRLDKSIIVIMRMVRDKLFQQIISGHKGKLCATISSIRSSHKKSDSICDQNLVTKTDDAFIVPSQNSTEMYYVQRDVNTCKCALRCEDCSTCIHEFYCSCIESCVKFNMCKHIHAVARFTKNVPATQENNSDAEDDFENDLFIQEEGESDTEFETILEEISTKKMVPEEDEGLQKRQDRLVESISAIVRNTTSAKEIESLEAIAASMAPTVAAVRDSNRMDTKSFVLRNSSRGNVTPQRRLFSTKKKASKKSTRGLNKPNNSDSDALALSYLLPK